MKESEEAPLVDPDQLSEWIIYEDQDLLVFDKPGWLVCHPSKNGPWSSLVGAAKEYLNVDSNILLYFFYYHHQNKYH